MSCRILRTYLRMPTKRSNKTENKRCQDPICYSEKAKCICTMKYTRLNDIYDDFVPQKELSDEQKYFSPSFISSENPSNESSSDSSSETKPTNKPMLSANPILVDLNQMENDFQKLFEMLKTASKRESIFYTSPEEKRLINFCQQQRKPILHKMQFKLEIFQKRFLKDIKEMKDFFESSERDLSETWKQNKILKDQLLKATLKHEIKCCVLLSHECVDNNMQDEIEKVQRDFIEIQEGMQKHINILENDVQRCQKQRLSATSNVRRSSNRDSSFKDSLISNTKNSAEKVEVSNRTNKKPDVASKNITLNTFVTNDEIKNAL
ncbi:hypothetical protein Tco_0152935 [Tanacetum coccineum]